MKTSAKKKKKFSISEIYENAIKNKKLIEEQIGISPIQFSIPFINNNNILCVSVKEEKDLDRVPESVNIPINGNNSAVVFLVADMNFEGIEQARRLFV
jgi:hypothetical protein